MPGKSDKKKQDEQPNWIVVARVAGVMHAQMLAERLRSLKIPAIANHEAIASVYGLTVGSLGEARVLVPESFLEQARLALQSGMDSGEEDDFEDEDFDDEDFDESDEPEDFEEFDE